MGGAWKYVCLDVFLTAGLPVVLAFGLRFASARQLDVHDFLGDAQLCLFAAILAWVTVADLLRTEHAAVLPWLDKGAAVFTLLVLATIGVVGWFAATVEREATGTARERVSRFVTYFSIAVAVATSVLAGLCKYGWGLLE
jgi:hypothetical protein